MIRSAFVLIVRTLTVDWIVALQELAKAFCGWLKDWRSGGRPPIPPGCVWIDHPAFVRPDPLIYSQQFLTAQGLAVTWDNPDIQLFRVGVPVSSSSLEPATTYEVRARIWNRSAQAPVIDMPVHLSFLNFGIGTQPNPVGTKRIDVGVLGSSNQPSFVNWDWTTPSTPGHYCLQVQLDPIDDLNFADNLGQENTDVVEAHSPAMFSFTLRNEQRELRRYRFQVDAYELPALSDCGTPRKELKIELRRHRRVANLLPPGFSVQISPEFPTLDPDESVVVTVAVEPPAGFTGRQSINVNAFHEFGFAGGVTLTCVKGL